MLQTPAMALMAGAAPDSPALRIDANSVESDRACVASLVGNGCYSAVCITPTFALTAGHVARQSSPLHLYLNLGRDLSHRFAVRRSFFPPVPAVPADPAKPLADLALIELDGRLPESLVLPRLARTPAQEGLRIEMAGYGASGFGDHGVSVGSNPALRRVGANRIERVLRAGGSVGEALLYYFRFDSASPLRREAGRSLGNAVETGLASGDSGSPAFVREDGRWALLGINSFVLRHSGPAAIGSVENGFGTVGGGQVLAAHRPWLRSVLGPTAWPGL